jgi:hypothetical protein
MIISKSYTLSLHPKAKLRQDLDSWRGRAFTNDEAKGFPVESVIGAACQLSITHSPKPDGSGVFVNIAGVMGIPKGMGVAELAHDKIHYELEMGQEGNPVFDSLAEWIQERIKGCVELNPGKVQVPQPQAGAPVDEDDGGDDSVPFSFILPWLTIGSAAASALA